MKLIFTVMILSASLCHAQNPADFKPASSNVMDAQFPKVDSESRVQIRFKAPEATKVNGAMADPAAFAKRVHLLWIGVGTNEPDRMKTGLEALDTALNDGNIKHVFYESPGTDHEWQTWRRDLKDFAPRLFQSGSKASPSVSRQSGL
jgi:enterochelin esterase-like enzyme